MNRNPFYLLLHLIGRGRNPVTFLLSVQLIFVLISIYLLGFQSHPAAAAGTSPILILVNNTYSANPFGPYLGEIMRAEGINTYNIEDISVMTTTLLTGYELVILAETDLTTDQATLLTDYVTDGGRLLAMRPDSNIAPLFGISGISGPLADGYLKISDTITFTVGNIPPGLGLATETLQIHGEADQYTLDSEAITLAQLYSSITTTTSYPSVVAGSEGRAVAFAYDLPRNVVYTRQGNPANANVDTDGDGVLRTIDLYQTTGGGAPWVNRDRIPIPQADEQQRFFARLVHQLVGFNMPLPQLWYFPEDAKTMLILTSDSHGQATVYYDALMNSVENYGGSISFYISQSVVPGSENGGDQVAYLAALRADGHEMNIHPGPDWAGCDDLIERYWCMVEWWGFQYGTIERGRTIRNHRVEWLGWADIAEHALNNYDVRMFTDVYHYGLWLRKADLSWPMGYINGSGLPMKYVLEDGTILDTYQQATQLVDEHILNGAGAGWMNLTYAQSITVSQQLIEQSLMGDYASLTTQFHVDYSSQGDGLEWAEGTMAYAQANGVPIWSADNWLNFTEMRYGAAFESLTWNNSASVLTFDLEVDANPGVTMTVMIPTSFKARELLDVRIDTVSQPITPTETIKGAEILFVSVPAGNGPVTYEIEAIYASPTAITLRSFASDIKSGLTTDAAAILFVLFGSATLIFLLERRRRTSA